MIAALALTGLVLAVFLAATRRAGATMRQEGWWQSSTGHTLVRRTRHIALGPIVLQPSHWVARIRDTETGDVMKVRVPALWVRLLIALDAEGSPTPTHLVGVSLR